MWGNRGLGWRKDTPRSYSKGVVRRDKMPCSVPTCYTVSFSPSLTLFWCHRGLKSWDWGRGLPEKHAEGKLLRGSNIASESEIWEDLDICILDTHITPSSIAKSLLRNSGLEKLRLCCCRIMGSWSTYLHQGKAPAKLAHSQSWGARHIPRKSTHEKYSSSPLSTGGFSFSPTSSLCKVGLLTLCGSTSQGTVNMKLVTAGLEDRDLMEKRETKYRLWMLMCLSIVQERATADVPTHGVTLNQANLQWLVSAKHWLEGVCWQNGFTDY